MSNTPEYKEYWEDGVLRMKVRIQGSVEDSLPCPDDIDEKDFRGLHQSAKLLLIMRGRKPLITFWPKK